MAAIEIKIIDDLLIATVSGTLTAAEVIEVVNEYYPGGVVRNVIWDLTHGSLHFISHEGFRSIAKAAKEAGASGIRRNGKTVYVGSNEIECGLLSMYTAIAEVTGVAAKYEVFTTIREAEDWIVLAVDKQVA